MKLKESNPLSHIFKTIRKKIMGSRWAEGMEISQRRSRNILPLKKILKITSVGDAANIVLSVLLSNEVIRTKGKKVEMLSKVQ